LEGHLQYNHGGDNPLTLPENIEVLKKPLSKCSHVMKVRQEKKQARRYVGEKSDQDWKYQDKYVPISRFLDVHVYGGMDADFSYDRSEESQPSTTDTTPNKNDSSLVLDPLVLESASDQMDVNSFVQTLFAY